MAEDARNRDTKKKTPPGIELGWDPLVPAPDGTYSTTIRVALRGWWEGGRPRAGTLFLVKSGALPPGVALRLQEPQTTYPTMDLEAGHHYEVKVVVGNESAAKLMVVPMPPKPKSAEELALEHDKLKLEQAKVTAELAKLQKRPDSNEKKLADARLRLELARIDAELKKLSATLSDTERDLAEERLKLERTKIAAELKKLDAAPSETERNLAEARLKLELARITTELEKLVAQPSSLETALAEARLQRDLAKTKQELAETGKRPERPPKTLSVERIGRKPNLQFAISLTAADGRGTAGVVEAICLGYGAERVNVDESGSRVWPDVPIDFTEKMRRYRFRIAGADSANKEATKECVAF